MSFLQVENLKKDFGQAEVIKGVDFSLEKGEVLSIIGSSGSGKTTLLRCLNFLEKPTSGKIILNNEILFDSNNNEIQSEKVEREKRLKMGLVFQSFNLFPHKNVISNLTLAPILLLKEELSFKKKELIKKDRKERKSLIKEYSLLKQTKEKDMMIEAKLLLEKVGLSDKENFYPWQLSGGQQQRVAIARALMLKPEILCFDEPTSALDPELTGEVLKVIRGLKDKDRTMIVVTHEMDFAKNVSDKVIFMADGVIVEQGRPEEIFDNPQQEKTKNFLRKSLDLIGGA